MSHTPWDTQNQSAICLGVCWVAVAIREVHGLSGGTAVFTHDVSSVGWLVSKSAPRGVSEASCLLSEGPALNEAMMIQPGTSSIRWEGGDEF